MPITIQQKMSKSVNPIMGQTTKKVSYVQVQPGENINYDDHVFETLKELIHPGNIQFVSIGQFFPYVMYVTPVLNEYLMDLQNKIYDAVKNIPEPSVSRFYQPYSWLPHVTLGKKLDEKQMAAAFEVLRKNFAPFEAVVTDIGLAKVNPHEDVRRFGLVTK